MSDSLGLAISQHITKKNKIMMAYGTNKPVNPKIHQVPVGAKGVKQANKKITATSRLMHKKTVLVARLIKLPAMH